MFWPTLTHYGWAVSIRTAGQFVALQVDSFHHNGWRYWVRIRTQLQKLLGSVFKAKGPQKVPPKRPADPVNVHIDPIRVEENGQAKILAKIKIKLKDEYKADELPAKIAFRVPVLANDNQTADDEPIPFRFKLKNQHGFGEYVAKYETQEILKKDEILEVLIESAEFPSYQVTRLDVFCGQGNKGEQQND